MAGAIPESGFERRENNKQLDAVPEELSDLDARSAQVVPLVIAALVIGTAVGGQILHSIKTKSSAEVKVPAGDNEPASQLLQESVNWFASNSDFTAMAVRSTVSHSVGFNGDFGKDWGSSTVTVDAAQGQSRWILYWARSGSLTVVTPNLAQDVVLGGSTSSSNKVPNEWTITIIH